MKTSLIVGGLLILAVPSAMAEQTCVGGGDEPNPDALANVCYDADATVPVPTPGVDRTELCIIGETCVPFYNVDPNGGGTTNVPVPIVTYVSVSCVSTGGDSCA